MSADSVAALVSQLSGSRLSAESLERHSVALSREVGAAAGGEVSQGALQGLARRAQQPSTLVKQYSACSSSNIPQVLTMSFSVP